MAQRYQLWIAYDGTPFEGWQSQPNGNTIQDHLESALETIAGQPIRIHGAGRTDAGVHALQQSAHFDADSEKSANEWQSAINGNLPPQIRVMAIQVVSDEFHARFSAEKKCYRYRIVNQRYCPPLELNRAWHIPVGLDLEAMHSAAQLLIGQHDFVGFAANRGEPVSDTTRTIYSIDLSSDGGLIELTFTGNGFLYKMVRLLTGTLGRIGQQRMDTSELKAILDPNDPAKSQYCAPAEGLYLERVDYPAVERDVYGA